ncbi:coiled-coil domain-containing protein [Staphylococcus hominis]|uniref:hypothetical protein n=1 Tax=Staphylococcus hominis TaxID=1290 RepID=UPI0006607A55|nr:hypothetical protein [Staphylococcus hominis]GGO39858.1 hypothetical protein GCM10011580_17660 [Plantactinospora veratri]KMU56452.1 hypothetical protein SHOMR3_0974 [Staphylococcus hominis]KMU58484.1 hypothetical protein SHOMR2_0762 [Staphylococcus hominis]MCI2874180.1 hypothetical protein [Staphylococcus hominis]MDS3896387.1 hypothetical protein [Staphylococcus hominis]
MKTLKQIEVHKKNIESYQKDIQALEQEVNNEKEKIDQLNKDYQELVVSDQVEKADKLYTKIDKQETTHKAKVKRLSVMKQSLKQVIIKNCSSMQEEADKLSDEYIDIYYDDLKHYNKLKEELKQAEQKLEEYNNSYLLKQRNLSHYIDRLIRENNIQPTEYMGTVNSHKPFYI